MLSTIGFCEDKLVCPAGGDFPVLLARTLAALVPAKADGMLSDVSIAGRVDGNLGPIANHAACVSIESVDDADRLRHSLDAAHGPKTFLLLCARVPEAGFIEEANDFLSNDGKLGHATAVLRESSESAKLPEIVALHFDIVGSRSVGMRKCVGTRRECAARPRPIEIKSPGLILRGLCGEYRIGGRQRQLLCRCEFHKRRRQYSKCRGAIRFPALSQDRAFGRGLR
jgi:hypothetical protein